MYYISFSTGIIPGNFLLRNDDQFQMLVETMNVEKGEHQHHQGHKAVE